ncbi:MAG: exodeoxyribonuclease III [Chloroflexota bacterium]|nr:exodeoxyribonuclease III [Chloroflexota bacterium]
MRKVLSWNVNGIRAIEKKGFLDWLYGENPDILAIQETKAHPDQLSDELRHPRGYHAYWNHAEKKGYSGVVTFSKEEPISIAYGFENEAPDREGRILVLEYSQFILLNIYFPNGRLGEDRLRFKLNFYQDFINYLDELRDRKKSILVCGDFNTAHKEIDIARPKENSKISGFLSEERGWLDRFIDWGLTDTFRLFNQEGGQYTWWDLKSRARDRNIGWRIDYFFVDTQSMHHIKDAFILSEVLGSDHCPIGIISEV